MNGWVSAAAGAVVFAMATIGAAHAQAPTVTPIPGKPTLRLGDFEAGDLGYDESEYFISGEATAYGFSSPPGEDGRWAAVPAGKAAYTTRIVVLRPKDAARFNGTVIVEWLNVSGGLDSAADWLVAHREIVRSGYAYVGVSAQRVGVEGGPAALGAMAPNGALKAVDPTRYGGLHHPGDAFSYDIYSQAGRVLRAARPGGVLGPLAARRILAIGASQSAAFLTTYVNAVDPLARVYDGFLLHSRFGGSAPLDGDRSATDPGRSRIARLRPDLRAPVLTFITETDLLGIAGLPGYRAARQPAGPHTRTWEIPGAAHADVYTIHVSRIDTGSATLEALAAASAPSTSLLGQQLPTPMNAAPQHHYVLQAALAALDRWVRTGQAPPQPPSLELAASDPPTLALDANGLAKGGARTPWVDTPAQRTSGLLGAGGMLDLFGRTDPFDAARLAALYPGGKADYLRRFEAALDASIGAGFILPADRAEILGLAALMYPGAN